MDEGILTIELPRLHNGTYTITNRKTGEHRTFEVKTIPENSKFAPGERIISLFVGKDNENPRDYMGFGFVRQTEIQVWRKHSGLKKGEAASVGDKMASMVWRLGTDPDDELHEAYDLQLAGTCVRCNRKLTNPRSIELGIGPECEKRL